MIIRTNETAGFYSAITAMRNPMKSWEKSDSTPDSIGPKDKALSQKLQKSGPEHCKHLRMIYVWADIVAPRYWWVEFDTYRTGVNKVSTSTMHRLTAAPLTTSDFENDNVDPAHMYSIVHSLNIILNRWREEKDEKEKKDLWRNLIQILPQSYLELRTVCCSYAALRSIVRQREGHKLKEWKMFIDWAHTLPNSWMIFD